MEWKTNITQLSDDDDIHNIPNVNISENIFSFSRCSILDNITLITCVCVILISCKLANKIVKMST